MSARNKVEANNKVDVYTGPVVCADGDRHFLINGEPFIQVKKMDHLNGQEFVKNLMLINHVITSLGFGLTIGLYPVSEDNKETIFLISSGCNENKPIPFSDEMASIIASRINSLLEDSQEPKIESTPQDTTNNWMVSN
jgi:hypothetical protein